MCYSGPVLKQIQRQSQFSALNKAPAPALHGIYNAARPRTLCFCVEGGHGLGSDRSMKKVWERRKCPFVLLTSLKDA